MDIKNENRLDFDFFWTPECSSAFDQPVAMTWLGYCFDGIIGAALDGMNSFHYEVYNLRRIISLLSTIVGEVQKVEVEPFLNLLCKDWVVEGLN